MSKKHKKSKMSRDRHKDINGNKTRSPEISIKKCPKCGHHKAWNNRGDLIPFYISKCCKCGFRQ